MVKAPHLQAMTMPMAAAIRAAIRAVPPIQNTSGNAIYWFKTACVQLHLKKQPSSASDLIDWTPIGFEIISLDHGLFDCSEIEIQIVDSRGFEFRGQACKCTPLACALSTTPIFAWLAHIYVYIY